MPLSETSIIAPGNVKSRAPLKKSTIVWVAGTVAFLAVMGVIAPQMMKQSSESNTPKTAPIDGMVGDARAIDREINDAKKRFNVQSTLDAQKKVAQEEEAKKKAADQPPVPSTVGLSGRVVPPEARRTSETAALYGKAAAPAGTADTASVEFDAAARTSPSVKHDFGGGVSTAKDAAGDVAAHLRTLMPSAPEPVGKANGGANSSDNTIAALLEAQRKGAGTSASGVSADQAWVKELASSTGHAKPIKSYPTVSPYTLLQGKVIPAVLGRDLNSDLPGEVTACTTVDIYDSISSAYLLIPKGSCLMGRYQSAIATGQERLMFAFTRIILPGGMSMDLPGNTGSDLSGAAGIAGAVNNHFFKMFSNSFLVAWLADRAEASKPAPTTTYGSTSGATTAAGQVLVDVSRSILDRQKNIPPTITIDKGTRINIEVTRDMEFPGPYRS